MKQLLIILLAMLMPLTPFAQTRKQTAKKKAKTTKVVKKKTTKRTSTRKKTTTVSTKEISGLRGERARVQRRIREQERRLAANKADVKKRLQTLMTINSEIDQRQKSIVTIQNDIKHIEGNIGLLKTQLATLEQQLEDRKMKFVKSMHYMARHRSIQDKLMFIFSAKNLTQMYRRLRFIREYAAYQRAQGEALKQKQTEIDQKNMQLERVKGNKNTLLYKGQREHTALQGQQAEQQKVVAGLQNQQKTIQNIIAEQRKKDAALNAQIDRLVAEEVAKARARAQAEARRKAAIEAERKRAAEIARRKAAAEAAAREAERRIAAAKAEEARRKAEAAAAARKSAEERERAEQEAREAEAARIAAERKAEADRKRNEKAIAEARKEKMEVATLDTEDRRISGSFESNRGRLPMPITGSYRIVSHFGQYNVSGLKNVTLDNKGINIMGQPGCQARSIFAGEVSAVFGYGGSMVVMVRHGAYISVYCNLRSVNVHRGQQVSARQALGAVGEDNILQFQLRRETAKLNPEAWLGR